MVKIRFFGVEMETDREELVGLFAPSAPIGGVQEKFPHLVKIARTAMREIEMKNVPVGRLTFKNGKVQAFGSENFVPTVSGIYDVETGLVESSI